MDSVETGYRAVLHLTWPLALGMANNALMQFADRLFLAHDSAVSLEAILPASMLAVTFIGFFQSLVSYTGVFAAHYHGAGDGAGCAASWRAGLLTALAGTLATWAAIPLGRFALSVSGHAPAVVAAERIYFDVLMAGACGTYVLMAAQGHFTGKGRTKCVFWVNLGGNVLNVALDAVLVFGCGPVPALGIAGAAFATVAAQWLQAIVLTVLAARAVKRETPRTDWRAAACLVPRVLRFGAPSGAYQTLNILSFTLFVFVSAAAGDLALAASNAVFAVGYLLFAPMEGFAVGAAALVGQCRGARDDAAAVQAVRRTLVLALGYVCGACALVWLFRREVLGLFAAESAGVDVGAFLALGTVLLATSIAWQVFDAVDTVVCGALRGAGDTRFVMTWMLVSAFGFWLPLVLLVRRFHPTMPAFWATMVAYVLFLCVGTVWRWRGGRWRRIKLT